MAAATAEALAAVRRVDLFIAGTGGAIVFITALGRIWYKNPITQDKTSILDVVSFSFIRPWIKKFPSDGPLMKVADLPPEPPLAPGERPAIAIFRARFAAAWAKSGGSASGAFFRLMLPWWAFTHIMQLPRLFIKFLPPLLVTTMYDFLEGRLPMSVGYKMVVLSALRMIGDKLGQALYLFSASNAGTQPAIMGSQAMVIEKMQTLSPRARMAMSASEVQTLFAKMDQFTMALSFPGQARLVVDALTVPCAAYFLLDKFGAPGVVAGAVAGAGLSLAAAKVGKEKTKSEQELRSLRKKQEAVLNELASNLPIWKLYGWVGYFIDRLNTLTDELERAGRWNNFLKTLTEVIPNSIGPTAVLISVGVSAALGNPVSLVNLLTGGSFISIISSATQAITEARQQWRDLAAECKNMDQILALPDAPPVARTDDGSLRLASATFGWPVKPPQAYKLKDATGTLDNGDALAVGDVVESVDNQKDGSKVRVRPVGGGAGPGGSEAGWVPLSALDKLPEPPLAEWPAALPGIAELDLHITKGELVLISGPVAGGKSTLMQSLVGNTEKLGGSIEVPESIAFQPQSPILFDQTIRANILFGIPDAEADESFLQESLVASTLSLDMDDQGSTLHAKRELTSCGQNGNELSGGQQARVALARCIYASLAGSEAVILDDPIKALDPATAALCWQQAIKGTMAGKTRVLVVNSQMLQRFASDKAVDRLIIVEKGGDDQPGRVTFNGKPSEMPASIPERLGDGYRIPDEPVEEPDEPTDDAIMVGYYVGNGEEPSVAACYSGAGKGDPKDEPEAAGKKKDKKKKRQKYKLKGDKGTVFAAVTNYCRRMGPWIVISGVLMGANQAANIVTYRWNSVLAANPQRFRVNYAIAIVLMVAAQAVRALSDFSRDGMGGETASKSIRLAVQKKLSVLGMPYLWDPDHSTAQLSDTVMKDPQDYQMFAIMPTILCQAAVSLGAIGYANPLLVPIAAVVLFLYKFVKKPFGWGIRQVYGGAVLECWIGMRKYSGEIFDGSPTIRAMGRSPHFDTITCRKFWEWYQLSPLFFGSLGRSNFYGMVVDTAWATISMAFVIYSRGKMAPAIALAIYQQLEDLNQFIGTFFTLCDAASQSLPNYMKVQNFLKVKECVGKSCIEEDTGAAPAGWPSDGTIDMQNIVFDYNVGAPPALNDVSLAIKPGEKIGVCGRTGAGKSTLLSVLFSLGPLTKGAVKVAGEDLQGISCHEVRQAVAIVPQFPTLFDGTVRENLLGGNRATDNSDGFLQDTLRTCRLAVLADRGLDSTLGTLSDGQKQLFCVARALVRRPKILVLDEATADLDAASAKELLHVVDEQFKETTVISIAHRLNFIRHSDRILVLNTGGTINAFDTPEELLKDTDGYFAKQYAEENQAM